MKKNRITKALGKKHDLDKIYTTIKNAEYCCDLIDFESIDCIIEHSAGNGAFLDALHVKNILYKPVFSYDIQPEDNRITQQDFLSLNLNNLPFENICVLGNPPYGVQNELSVKFFNHAAKHSNVTQIGFIIPLSFRKTSLQKRLNEYFHLKTDTELPDNIFSLNNKEYTVPTCFQLWERKTEKRNTIIDKTTSEYYEFTKDKNKAHVRIQRVGGNAGKASLEFNRADASNYWIILKTNKLTPQELINIVNNTIFPTINHTIGPKSLPKKELIRELDKNIQQHLNNQQ